MFKNLLALRAYFILLMVYHHCSFIPDAYQNGFGKTGVVLFFILSGFVLSYRYGGELENDSFSYWNYLKKRCLKFYPTHWLIAVLFIVFGLVQYDSVFWKSLPFNLTLTQSWIPLHRFYFSINGVSWFMSSLLFAYCVFPVLNRYANRKPTAFFVCFIVYCLIIAGVQEFWPNVEEGWMNKTGWFSHNPISCLRYFALGMVGFRAYKSFQKHIDKITYIGWLIAEVIVTGLCCVSLISYSILPYDLAALVLCALVVIFALEDKVINPGPVSQIMRNNVAEFIGGISFAIYMVHGFVIGLITPWAKGHQLLGIVVVYVLSIALACVIHYYYEPLFQVRQKHN